MSRGPGAAGGGGAPPGQLPLPLPRPDPISLAGYLGEANAEARAAVAAAVAGTERRPLYLWGPPGVGKTHLLLAAAGAVTDGAFVPARQYRDFDVECLAGLEEYRLVCLDDLHLLLGEPAWDRALFGLVERSLAGGPTLVLSAAGPPRGQPVSLADLASRLRAALVLQLRPPDDEVRMAVLQARARSRGFELPEDAARLMLRRAPRELGQLLAILERVDRRALAQGRRVTRRLVQGVLAEPDAGEPGEG